MVNISSIPEIFAFIRLFDGRIIQRSVLGGGIHERNTQGIAGMAINEAMILNWRSPFRLARAVLHAGIYLLQRKPVIAPKIIVAYRRSKCEPCKFRDHGQCRLCSCFIEVKTLMASESCPDGRWGKCLLSRKETTIDPQS